VKVWGRQEMEGMNKMHMSSGTCRMLWHLHDSITAPAALNTLRLIRQAPSMLPNQ